MAPVIRMFTRHIDGLREADLETERSVLSAAERERAARFVFETGRIEYIAAHALARTALAEATGVPPAALEFVDGPYGKPAVRIGGRPANVSFNLSHTRGMVAVGVAPGDFDLGIDAESGARKVDHAIADHFFAPPEIAWLNAQPSELRKSGFLTLWTLKEAFIKAIGKGLSQELDQFWFADPAAAAIRIGCSAEMGCDPSRWRFEHRVLDSGHHLAVGWEGPARVEWLMRD